jgi:ATP-dependent HslUV protease subunit HslV
VSVTIRREARAARSLSPRGPHRARATTIVAVRDERHVAFAGDGQVTFGQSVMKAGARKIRPLLGGKVLTGFAGSAADAFALTGRFEEKLEEHRGNLSRAAVELAKEWRTDRALRRLDALLLVADARLTYLVSGTGDLIEPDDGIAAIGSGSPAALGAARALAAHSSLGAPEIARRAIEIAASTDIYTNDRVHVESLSVSEAS